MDIAAVIRFTKEHLKNEKTGHDFYHGERVAHLASKMYLADHESAHEDSREVAIIKTAAYLHDTIDEKVCADSEKVVTEIDELLPQVGFNALEVWDILYTIQHMSFSANIEHHYHLPLSGQYVQDADRLESLGAIGIARAFTYGGKHGNKIYDPEIKPEKLVSHDQYRNHEETTINHFYEKLFSLADLMNTPAAKKEAQRRTEYMRTFVKEFMDEWSV
ncbi:HD domain-containing protein [Lactobacillus helveticus]|uniref:HD domain-containing protein n=1 Tax=Lactobacillus helveticus TaxID=1587 RepID=UPI0002EA90FC|nr:HD domain-containing protein [Lactobacillus helveticus]KGL04632.1 phosphohydrolase [Lactobacillus helveticus]KGL06343.1 phosphohydrolase [Lactobacillus helveticus]KRL39562.1 HD domain protein [Lactobacillus helveticus DSM 20075 = CGMCC 1.1877]MCT3394216.1 HD domain-containing protein [Lactobacillus helveticus]MCT3422127.1 HD domain-containing protein [Lactobacillus helveticus]